MQFTLSWLEAIDSYSSKTAKQKILAKLKLSSAKFKLQCKNAHYYRVAHCSVGAKGEKRWIIFGFFTVLQGVKVRRKKSLLFNRLMSRNESLLSGSLNVRCKSEKKWTIFIRFSLFCKLKRWAGMNLWSGMNESTVVCSGSVKRWSLWYVSKQNRLVLRKGIQIWLLQKTTQHQGENKIIKNGDRKLWEYISRNSTALDDLLPLARLWLLSDRGT